ncbi:MAG: hypothetical protein M0Z49_13200 [Chloroflexi bacterium]|nr:hypothetical protein [Chloroflexota bacterium]
MHEPFAARVRDALQEPLSTAQRATLDQRIEQALMASPGRSRRLPIRRSVLLAAALLVLLPTVFAVGAAILSTEDPYGLASAQEYQAELEAAKGVVPLPAGRTWPDHLAVQDGSGSYSRGGARSWVEINAVCIWFDDWRDAQAAGDSVRTRSDAAAIAAIPSWPSWQSPFWTQSVRDHLQPLIAAVAAGREQPIRDEITLNCGWLAQP